MVEDEEEKGGDITSKIQVWPRNIEEKIYELFLKNFFDEQKIMPKDITEVKRDLGLPMYDAPNAVEELKQPRKWKR